MSGLSDPRLIFGIHSVTCYQRSDGTPYGPMLRVLDGSSVAMSASVLELQGGSSKFSWAAEEGFMKAEMDLKCDEFPDFMFTLFLGTTPTAVSTPDTAGTISTAVNKSGTSVINASTGIATVTIKTASKADLKFGKYVIKVASATTVDIYALSDVDAARGTAAPFLSDLQKVASAQTITQGAGTDVAGLGITVTGGSGTIGMTTGDTATFEVLPPSSKSMSVVIGGQTATFPEFGALILAQKRGSGSYSSSGVSTVVTGEMFELDAFRCKGAGFPIDFNKAAWAKNSVKALLLYDGVQGGIAKVRTISPS